MTASRTDRRDGFSPALINLEIKIPVDDLDGLRLLAGKAGATFRGTLRQTDTFFEVTRGLLKLRVIEGAQAELISYERPETPGSRVSSYTVYPTGDPDLLHDVLSRCLKRGVRVRKRRDLWMWGGTRIHLDDVEALGTFVELETEGNTRSHEAMKEEHEQVMAFLKLDRNRAVPGSYAGMLAGN
jgi:adenylate cyclase class IV